jgi:hypothetical protein
MKKNRANKNQTLYILTEADRDRIDAAAGLLRQVLDELLLNRRVRVSLAVNSPGALYELESEGEKIREEQLMLSKDW